MILLEGGLEVLDGDGSPCFRVAPGQAIFIPGNFPHTHRSTGPVDARYVVFKWAGRRKGEGGDASAPTLIDVGGILASEAEPGAEDLKMSRFAKVACR